MGQQTLAYIVGGIRTCQYKMFDNIDSVFSVDTIYIDRPRHKICWHFYQCRYQQYTGAYNEISQVEQKYHPPPWRKSDQSPLPSDFKKKKGITKAREARGTAPPPNITWGGGGRGDIPLPRRYVSANRAPEERSSNRSPVYRASNISIRITSYTSMISNISIMQKWYILCMYFILDCMQNTNAKLFSNLSDNNIDFYHGSKAWWNLFKEMIRQFCKL